jgi:hypothetical protein
MIPSQYHHRPSILRSYFHKLIFILLTHYFLCHPNCPLPSTKLAYVCVSYPSCGLHTQHLSTSAILCRTYTFNIVSLRSILKCPLRPNSCFWFSKNIVVRHFHIMKINTFWPDTPCNFEVRYRHFGYNCRITEDGSRKFSRNTGMYFLKYTASRFRRL